MPHIRLLAKDEARPLPKWKQRQMKIDAYFNELGITPAEWRNRADQAAKGYRPKIGEMSRTSEGEWWYRLPDADEHSRQGDIVGTLRIIPDYESGKIHLTGTIFENGPTTYPGGYASTRRNYLWSDTYPDVDITGDPEGDIENAFAYADEFSVQYAKIAEERAAVVAQKATTVGGYKWGDVRREINDMTLWDVYDGDRPDITGYLHISKHPGFAFALYTPSGKVLHSKNLDSRSVNFAKMEVIPVEGTDITKAEADKINAKLARCTDGEQMGDLLWRKW